MSRRKGNTILFAGIGVCIMLAAIIISVWAAIKKYDNVDSRCIGTYSSAKFE